MAKTWITLTGTNHCFGTEILKEGTKLLLVKEPENEYDREAIRVEIPALGKIGYVANSTYTVKGNSLSAGRLYDRIGNKAKAKVVFVLPDCAICKVSKKSLLSYNRTCEEMPPVPMDCVEEKDGVQEGEE